jgi:mono/diheme cytochrome c family protein
LREAKMKKLIVAILFAALALGAFNPLLLADEQLTPADKRQLFREGAKLWPLYCNTCHNARPGSEKAPYEWDQIIMHMRMLGNVPPQDARAILEYLKAGK